MANGSKPESTAIIIIKKKKGHGAGHHGGAWKVAYADFVTAMMALFIVLWLLSSSADVKQAVGGYFQQAQGNGAKLGSAMGGSGAAVILTHANLSHLKERLEKAMKQNPQFEKLRENVEITITGEGLRIELLESEKGMFFENGEASPTELGRALLTKIADELGQLPSSILVEGHTDARQFQGTRYSNWELSIDRANSARRLMQEHGLHPGQVRQVRGYGSQLLRLPDKPEDASNRRISIVVQFTENPGAAILPEKGGVSSQISGPGA